MFNITSLLNIRRITCSVDGDERFCKNCDVFWQEDEFVLLVMNGGRSDPLIAKISLMRLVELWKTGPITLRQARIHRWVYAHNTTRLVTSHFHG